MKPDPRNIEVMDEAMVPVLRAQTGRERVSSMLDLMVFSRDATLLAIRQQHPEWSQERVRAEAARRLFGDTR